MSVLLSELGRHRLCGRYAVRQALPAALATALALGLTVADCAAGPAIGQFELKTLESEPGYLEFQSQNAYSWGQPSRRTFALGSGDIAYDENSVTRQRHALEMEMGYTRHFKTRIGIEFEKERIEEPGVPGDADAFGNLNLSEIGAEAIVILIPRDGDGFGLGVVVEVEHPLEKGEANSVLFGPIFELASGPWSSSLIPMLVHPFGGEKDEDGRRDDKWDFAYAAQVAYTFSDTWTLALEAYGTVDRIGSTGHRSEAARLFGDFDQHRLGPIIYYNFEVAEGATGGAEGSEVSIGMGLLAGLNGNTPDGTLKLSVEVEF